MREELLSSPILFALEAISFLGERSYLVRLNGREGKIEAVCEVRKVEGQGFPPFDLVEFNSEEFNDLCARGNIYYKSLGKAILAFHECIYPICGNK